MTNMKQQSRCCCCYCCCCRCGYVQTKTRVSERVLDARMISAGLKQDLRVPYVCLLLLLIDHLDCLKLVGGHWLAPQPNRTLPAELIVLEDGSTTFVSASLEDFLDSSTSRSAAAAAAATTTRATTTTRSSPPPAAEEEQLKNLTHQSLSATQFEARNEQLERESTHQARTEASQQQHNQKLAHHEERQNFFEKAASHHAGNSSSQKPIPQHWQVKSLLNVTHDYPLEYSQIICGYVWPLMAAITLFTNLMIVFVLTQRDMRTPTNVVLTAIAIADIIPIVVPVPWFVYLFAMGNEKQVLYPPIACYFYQHSTRSVSEVFYFLSTWLNVLLAVQDYLTACWPKLAKKYCQIRVVIIEIVALTLLAFLLNLPQALKLVFKPVKFYYNGELTWGCRALQAKWFKDLVGEYVALYDDIFTAIIVVFVDGGPAIALITLTALLIRQLQRQRIQGHLLMEQARTASKRRRERHRQQEYEASARVMIFVLLAFLAVKIPFATTYTLMIIQSRFEIHFVENLVDFQKAITLTDLVFVLSYPINFTIFCGCSKKFRHKCAQLLGECNQNTKSAKNRLMSSFSSSFNSDNTTIMSHHQMTNDYSGANNGLDKRDSLGTVLSGQRNSSISLLVANNNNNKFNNSNTRDSLTTTGALICCNGTSDSNRKLSQPQPPGESDQEHHTIQQRQRQRQRALPSPIFEDATGSQESVRALADDGLCVECIMRYEQMKRSSGSIATSHLSGGHHQQPRLSTDSGTSWQMPPPPPPLQFCMPSPGQQLPHIVTTRCESIRERSSSEELNQDGQQMASYGTSPSRQPDHRRTDQESTTHRFVEPHEGRPIEQQPRGVVIGPEVDSTDASAAEDSRGRIQSRGFPGSSARGSSDPGTVRGATLRQQSLGYNHLDEHYLHGRDIRFASHSNESMSSAGWGEDSPRSSRRHFDESPSSSGKQKKNLRAPTLKQIENKHRSLSMSNSKLSALAGATGLLADIIKSTLLTTNPSAPGSSS